MCDRGRVTNTVTQTIALDTLHSLRKRVRMAQREKLGLRDEILRVRAEREQVALRMDAIRIRHEAESKAALVCLFSPLSCCLYAFSAWPILSLNRVPRFLNSAN